ncbi:hypothetical protein NKS28_01430 [Bacillus sp. 1663tsa1]|uniref:hypothetical protein n=1 Tax=Bacillus sp. 1663tsa1 TaxID=2953804 RepID=UPI00209CFB86|nr:hypothetical protein [Bacillus sp. 1663tsa1]MCP1176189.1 hypothetical protein [Bacillus sp. 1663tsa1]
MANYTKSLPEWKNKGIEPPQGLKDTGWKVAQKPPAPYFDWFFNRTYEALKELQEGSTHKTTVGDLLTLKTLSKDTIVASINEIKKQMDTDLSPNRDGVNVKIKDTGGYYPTDDVESALQQVGLSLKNANQSITTLTQDLSTLSAKQTQDITALTTKHTQDVTAMNQTITTHTTNITDLTKKTTDNINLLNVLKVRTKEGIPVRSGKDSNGIYTIYEEKSKEGVLLKRSVLSNPDFYGTYYVRTLTYLDDDGTYKTEVSDLKYDDDGDFEKAVPR